MLERLIIVYTQSQVTSRNRTLLQGVTSDKLYLVVNCTRDTWNTSTSGFIDRVTVIPILGGLQKQELQAW